MANKKRQCISCGKDVEIDEQGNYKCEACGYDRAAARERIKQQQALDKEREEMTAEEKSKNPPTKDEQLRKRWGW